MKKINAQTPFPYQLPYRPLFAERNPLLYLFRAAVANLQLKSQQDKRTKSILNTFLELVHNSDRYFAAECGVYQGNSLIACAEIVRESGLPIHLYGFDTFSGLPPLSEKDKRLAPKDALYRDNILFSDTTLAEVQHKIDEKDLTKLVSLVPGLFRNTLPSMAEKSFFFVNIDCDLYKPHIECLEFFYPLVEKGGMIFFDDYHSKHYPMARAAIDFFMKDRPEELFHLRFGKDDPNHTKTFIVKS
ncbi:MAG: TylF/MycF/NovP-related O-methyltransferase [Prochloraceae cyanobacterium]